MKFATQSNDATQVGRVTPCAPTSRDRTLRAIRGGQGTARPTSASSAFTLAEVLAALLFLAIVIPAAVEALHISSLAGEVAARKGQAARIADRLLNESIVTTNWNRGAQSGTISEGTLDFRYKLATETWPVDAMQLLTAEVTFSAKGHDYSVKLSTLADPQALNTGTATTR